jgi:hypothetical protein
MLKLAGTLMLVTTVTTGVVSMGLHMGIEPIWRGGAMQTVDRAPDVIRGRYFNHIVLQDSPYRTLQDDIPKMQAGEQQVWGIQKEAELGSIAKYRLLCGSRNARLIFPKSAS